MVFIVFFIPHALLCILGGIGLTAAMGIGQASQSISMWFAENYLAVVGGIAGIAVVAACVYAKRVNVASALAGAFAVSSPFCLLADTMYQVFRQTAADSFGNGWLLWIIAVPILVVYLVLHGVVLLWGFLENMETGRSGGLWLLGAVGWIVIWMLFG